jgi:hypothetical protein
MPDAAAVRGRYMPNRMLKACSRPSTTTLQGLSQTKKELLEEQGAGQQLQRQLAACQQQLAELKQGLERTKAQGQQELAAAQQQLQQEQRQALAQQLAEQQALQQALRQQHSDELQQLKAAADARSQQMLQQMGVLEARWDHCSRWLPLAAACTRRPTNLHAGSR